MILSFMPTMRITYFSMLYRILLQDGRWTYAICASRPHEPVIELASAQDKVSTDTLDECIGMVFVTNELGATKFIKKKKWGDHIRHVVLD